MRERANRGLFYGGCLLVLCLCAFLAASLRTQAMTYEESVDAYLIPSMDVTPDEPATSDISVVQTVTKLDSKRWIQSFCKDSKYYYYIQLTNAKSSKHCADLRITRVKYTGLGRYLKDHMDLLYFGHGTNLDCSEHNGVTYLWTGCNAKKYSSGYSDVTRAVTCFPYVKNRKLYHRGQYTYKIRKAGTGKYVTNVYPAINHNSSRMAVRYTYGGRQYFQTYSLINGTQILADHPIKTVSVPATSGDFQGFDYYGKNLIYTIEGSPNKAFLRAYDKRRIFQPTYLTTWNMATRSKLRKKITGAKKLTFREPEGVKLLDGKKIQIMFVSFRLTDQSCNIYSVK